MNLAVKNPRAIKGKRYWVEFETDIEGHGEVHVEAMVLRSPGSREEPPDNSIEDVRVLANGTEISGKIGEYDEEHPTWAGIDDACFRAAEAVEAQVWAEYEAKHGGFE